MCVDEYIPTCDLCRSVSTRFFLNASAPFRDENIITHDYTFHYIIIFIRKTFNTPLDPSNVRGTQQGSCEA